MVEINLYKLLTLAKLNIYIIYTCFCCSLEAHIFSGHVIYQININLNKKIYIYKKNKQHKSYELRDSTTQIIYFIQTTYLTQKTIDENVSH